MFFFIIMEHKNYNISFLKMPQTAFIVNIYLYLCVLFILFLLLYIDNCECSIVCAVPHKIYVSVYFSLKQRCVWEGGVVEVVVCVYQQTTDNIHIIYVYTYIYK